VTSLIFSFCVCVSCSCPCVFSFLYSYNVDVFYHANSNICVRCYSSGLTLVCQFVVLHVLCVFYVFWVVTLRSQLLCLCLFLCCVRVAALVCLCRLQSYVVLFSYLFALLLFIVLFLFYQFVYYCICLYCLCFFDLVLYTNTCNVLCFVYMCTHHCFCCCPPVFSCYKLFCVLFVLPAGRARYVRSPMVFAAVGWKASETYASALSVLESRGT